MRYRDLIKMNKPNDGTRSLIESTMMPELTRVLRDWCRGCKDGVLIGGLALSYYVKPRMTQDVGFLFISDAAIPASIKGFKRTRDHAYQHNQTHAEVELVTPELVGVPSALVEVVISTATQSDGVRIASASGLVALKLHRLSAQDKADIIALVKTGQVRLDLFAIPADKIKAFQALAEEAATDPHPG